MDSDTQSVHPVDCRCERKKCKDDRKWRSTSAWFKLRIVAPSSDSVVSNQPGPGRTLDNFFGWAGKRVNHWVECVAIWRGKGPLATEEALRRLVYGEGDWSKILLAPGFGTLKDISQACKQLQCQTILFVFLPIPAPKATKIWLPELRQCMNDASWKTPCPKFSVNVDIGACTISDVCSARPSRSPASLAPSIQSKSSKSAKS